MSQIELRVFPRLRFIMTLLLKEPITSKAPYLHEQDLRAVFRQASQANDLFFF
jgi:hypothetical protein